MKEDVFKGMEINGKSIDDATKQNWYKAREYVIENLPEWEKMVSEGRGIHKDSDCHLHFSIKAEELNPLTMSVLRHIALSAHYTNFKEDDGENATVISIVCSQDKRESIENLLKKDEYFGNLYEICNEPYIDVKICFLKEVPAGTIPITKKEVEEFGEEFPMEMDVTMAQYVNMVYNTGVDIDNLPPDDPNTAERYNLALDVFFYHKMAESQRHWDKIVGKDVKNQYKIRNKLSNVYCADCFESRIRGVIASLEGEDKVCFGDAESISDFLKSNETMSIVKEAMAKNLETIARCEHSRWVVEKLVLGFSPFGKEEMMEDEECFGKARRDYRKRLKEKDFKHIDLCSYRDLKRVNPGDMKYDCFLMLAIPLILEKVHLED